MGGFPWWQSISTGLAHARLALVADWGSRRFGILMSLVWILALVIADPLIGTLHMAVSPAQVAVAVVGDVVFGGLAL